MAFDVEKHNGLKTPLLVQSRSMQPKYVATLLRVEFDLTGNVLIMQLRTNGHAIYAELIEDKEDDDLIVAGRQQPLIVAIPCRTDMAAGLVNITSPAGAQGPGSNGCDSRGRSRGYYYMTLNRIDKYAADTVSEHHATRLD